VSFTMHLLTGVTFETSIPFDLTLHPIGEEIATYISNSIEARSGMRASIDNWRDCGYELDFQVNGKELHFAFVYVKAEHYQFYGQVASYVGWIRRLLGYRDNDEEAILIRALHELLTDDPVFSEVYWHEASYDDALKSKYP
jgi:hypothetical protein